MLVIVYCASRFVRKTLEKQTQRKNEELEYIQLNNWHVLVYSWNTIFGNDRRNSRKELLYTIKDLSERLVS